MKERTSLTLLRFVAILLIFLTLPRLLCPILTFPDNWFVSLSMQTMFYLIALVHRIVKEQAKRKAQLSKVLTLSPSDQAVMWQSGQEEFRFTKTLQWNTAYYVIAVFGALFGLARLVRTVQGNVRQYGLLILYGLASALLVYGIALVCEIQYKLRNYRISLDDTRFFAVQYRTSKGFDKEQYRKDRLDDRRFWRDPRVTMVLIFTIVISFICVAVQTWGAFSCLVVALLGNLFR